MKGIALIKGFFYGNYFYAICAVALSIECSLQLGLPLNNIFYYLLLSFATVLYYTHAYYIEIKGNHINLNERTAWYLRNKKKIEGSQLIFTFLIAIISLLMVNGLQPHFSKVNFKSWLLLFTFLLMGIAYYKHMHPFWGNWGLRNHGLIKPLVIGLVWAGAVSFSPVFFYDLSYPGQDKSLELLTWLLFIKNWLFISILCILFDIKDYANDANQQLKTWVVQFGLKKTLYWVIYPMTILSILAYWIFAIGQDFSIFNILFNSLPYLLLITVCTYMHQRKSILYYLAIIDGLMLVKAICGITSLLGN
ncbi:MAG: UbiA family prenyltransferase [Sediminibacterium sp.]